MAGDYSDRLLKECIHAYKYRFVRDLGSPLGEFLEKAVRNSNLPLPDLILPVPLHPWRYRYRGFNQAEILAHHLSTHLLPGSALPLETTVLLRKRFTLPQKSSRNAEERRQNLKGAFTLSKSSRHHIQGKTVWLIDDVAATGTTLEECARTLKKAGVTKVTGVVLAR